MVIETQNELEAIGKIITRDARKNKIKIIDDYLYEFLCRRMFHKMKKTINMDELNKGYKSVISKLEMHKNQAEKTIDGKVITVSNMD